MGNFVYVSLQVRLAPSMFSEVKVKVTVSLTSTVCKAFLNHQNRLGISVECTHVYVQRRPIREISCFNSARARRRTTAVLLANKLLCCDGKRASFLIVYNF